MAFPAFHYNPGQEPPFTILIEHGDKTQDGHWRPAAFVGLTPSLRTSGFLGALPPEELKNFLLLLSFVTPNGHIAPTLPQLAAALRVSQAKARARMERLTALRWHNQPIVLSHQLGNGLDAFTPAPGFLPLREESADQPVNTQAPYQAAPRAVIIEQSRRLYGRPRAEVERQIAARMGWKKPDDASSSPKPDSDSAVSALVDSDTAESTKAGSAIVQGVPNPTLRDELLDVGLQPEQADSLLKRYDEIRIRRQLMWLPYRTVRNRAGFLLAAIKDDYEAPLNWHRSHSHGVQDEHPEPGPITISPDETENPTLRTD